MHSWWAEARPSSGKAAEETEALAARAAAPAASAALEAAIACSSAARSSVAEPQASQVVVVMRLMRVQIAQAQVVEGGRASS
jgi:hypothetical protein